MSDNQGPGPTVIRKARWRVWTPFIVSIFGLASYFGSHAWLWSLEGLEGWLSVFTSSLADTILIVVPGLLVLGLCGVAIQSLFWGDYIAPDNTGIRFRINGRTRFVRWERVGRFRTESPVLGQEAVVGWDYAEHVRDAERVKSPAATTMDSDFGVGWQGGPEAVCIKLEGWRSRYSQPLVSEEEKNAAHPDIAQGGTDFPSSLTVRTDTRKAIGPLLVIWACFFGLFALPIWITTMAAPTGQALTVWTSLADDWLFWFLAAMYSAMGAWFGYVAYLLTRRFLLKPTILLSPEGFTVKDEAGVQFTHWKDVEAFGIAHDSNNHREYLGWRFRPGVTKVENWRKPSLDLDASVGMDWQGSVHDLRDTFDAWRRRYGDR